ncbi:hypothetical protein TNCV_2363391 [Trichonephila clavipes]|nr:hypothetical protein TNCV_2363391 [Trichonephila clavipes]
MWFYFLEFLPELVTILNSRNLSRLLSARCELRKKIDKKGEIVNLIKEVVILSWQINVEVDGDCVQELLDSHYQEHTIEELIEAHQQDIEESLSLAQFYQRIERRLGI